MGRISAKQHAQALWLVKGLQWMLDHPAESHKYAEQWAQAMVRHCLTYHDVGRIEILVADLDRFMEDVRASRALRERERAAGQAGGGLAVDEGQPDPPGPP